MVSPHLQPHAEQVQFLRNAIEADIDNQFGFSSIIHMRVADLIGD